MKRRWLGAFGWAVVVQSNRQLCLPKGALHRATSMGHEPARQLWEAMHCTEMTLAEATDLCRKCHQLAPFCNFNGNTFVAIIRQVIAGLSLPAERAAVLRSLAGHIVAGTATPEERKVFGEVLGQLELTP